VKYLQFPELDGLGVTYCQECFIPNMQLVLVMSGETPAETFDEMVVQMDESQLRMNGAPDPHRPEIVEEAPDLVCKKCNREGVAA
jgi:hypothetical protein